MFSVKVVMAATPRGESYWLYSHLSDTCEFQGSPQGVGESMTQQKNGHFGLRVTPHFPEDNWLLLEHQMGKLAGGRIVITPMCP